jgi:hypothetical protein
MEVWIRLLFMSRNFSWLLRSALLELEVRRGWVRGVVRIRHADGARQKEVGSIIVECSSDL